MTLKEALGGDVRRIYEQVDALLDKEDGVLVLFDGGRLVTYAQGFGVSASQLELLGMQVERTLRAGIGQQGPRRANRRRNRERNQGAGSRDDVNGHGHGPVGRVLQLASKIA
jgi:hypothetical protein